MIIFLELIMLVLLLSRVFKFDAKKYYGNTYAVLCVITLVFLVALGIYLNADAQIYLYSTEHYSTFLYNEQKL